MSTKYYLINAALAQTVFALKALKPKPFLPSKTHEDDTASDSSAEGVSTAQQNLLAKKLQNDKTVEGTKVGDVNKKFNINVVEKKVCNKITNT